MSDTPETDEQIGCGYEVEGKVRLVQLVHPDFARRLERERNEAREAFVIATDQLVQVQSELRQAREGVARLQMELETLKQAASVRINVEHTELRQARDENAKLREALEKSKEFVQSWGELIDTQYPLWNECMTTIQKALTP